MSFARRFQPLASALALTISAAPLVAQAPATQTLLASALPADSTPVTRTPPKDSQPAAPVKAPPPAPFLGIKLSGFAETAFNRSNRPNGTVIADRVFEQANNHLSLNALKLTLDRAIDPTRFDLGLHADALFGDNAKWLQSPGYNLGAHGDLYQAYATLNVPTPDGNGIQLKAGRMATFLGVEVIEAPFNPNVSMGNAFYFAENFTQTGISIEHRFNAVVDAQVRVFKGWDQITDVNSRYSYMARVGLAPDALTSLAVAAFVGPEQAGDNTALRSGVQLIAARKVGRVTVTVQGDAGREARNAALPDPTRDATWWAASSWVSADVTSKVGVALRGDYLSDRGASRTAGAFSLVGAPDHRLASATATLNLKALPGVLLRPEVRYDRSNQSDFASRGNQVTLGLSAVFLF